MFVLMGFVHDVFFQRTFWFAAGMMLLRVPLPGEPQSSSNAVS